MKVVLDGNNLTIEDVAKVALEKAKVIISEEAEQKVRRSRELVDKWVKANKVMYGITTGCGPMCNKILPIHLTEQFQENLVISHSAGGGDYLKSEIVRAIMVARANSLAKGHSGIRMTILQTLVDMLNKDVHPRIPELGSVGASGDLVHLAHMALCIIGKGECEYNGNVVNTEDAMRLAGIVPAKLSYKEGLALMNGTSAMTGIAAIAVYDAENLIIHEEMASALAFEVMHGITDPLEEELQILKPHNGQIKTAANIRRILEGSGNIRTREEVSSLIEKERENSLSILHSKINVQNEYSIRCPPQLIGTQRTCLEHIKKVITTELNSANDNPLIDLVNNRALHGGNFHGQEVSTAMDLLSISMAQLCVLSERRLARILDVKTSEGLPEFLIRENTGLENGFMGSQYIATSTTAENIAYSNPVSVGSIPTNANNQDVVSMGTVAARKAYKVVCNSKYVTAVSLMALAQAVEFRGKNKLGRGSNAAYKTIRESIKRLDKDIIMYYEIKKMVDLINQRKVIDEVENTVGSLR